MKTILVTGAHGYFGGIACEYFCQKGWKVLKATRRPGDGIYFDLDHPESFASRRLPEKVDVFLHAAAAHEVTCAKVPYQAVSQNVGGTLAALDFAVAHKIPQFVYLSTFHVFGAPRGILDETTLPTPQNVYGLSHLFSENCVEMYDKKGLIKGLSVRPANFYGLPVNLADFSRWTLTPFSFVKEALETGKIVLKTPGFQKRNFVFVPSICELIEDQLMRNLPHPLLHAVGQETLSIRQLASLVQGVLQKSQGREIEIAVPEGEASEAEFSFASVYEKTKAAPSLSQFIEQLAQAKGGNH